VCFSAKKNLRFHFYEKRDSMRSRGPLDQKKLTPVFNNGDACQAQLDKIIFRLICIKLSAFCFVRTGILFADIINCCFNHLFYHSMDSSCGARIPGFQKRLDSWKKPDPECQVTGIYLGSLDTFCRKKSLSNFSFPFSPSNMSKATTVAITRIPGSNCQCPRFSQQ
jgi:hypothetical protein